MIRTWRDGGERGGGPWRIKSGGIFSSGTTILATVETWSIEHRVFVYNIGRHGRVPKFDTIMKWVNNLDAVDFGTRTCTQWNRMVRTPNNIERVRQAVQTSP